MKCLAGFYDDCLEMSLLAQNFEVPRKLIFHFVLSPSPLMELTKPNQLWSAFKFINAAFTALR